MIKVVVPVAVMMLIILWKKIPKMEEISMQL